MRCTILLTLACCLGISPLWAQDRDTKVRNDRSQFESVEHWVYNDLDQALAEARLLNKPLLIVFRCIPCEACHDFDEQVARRDAVIRDIMDQFVCVRIVQANGLDLSLFQFDFDQSFAIVLMHPDKTILGRFGTRSNRDNEEVDISLEGLRQTLEGALQLHRSYSAIRESLAGKQVTESRYRYPEDFPHLADKYDEKLDYEGQVASSCIHCHQVGEAQRRVHRAAGRPVPDQILFPHPNPTVLGLRMDPQAMATVAEVTAGSSAERDGFRAGDRIIKLEGQPLLSTADIQWVLHQAPAQGRLTAQVQRDAQELTLPLTLPEGWRRNSDLSWRTTTWGLRRMGLGGLVLEDLSDEERQELGVSDTDLALRVKHVGQYGEHAVAKRAGFQKEDVIVRFDELTDRLSEMQLIAYTLQQKQPGQSIKVDVVRDGQTHSLNYKLQ